MVDFNGILDEYIKEKLEKDNLKNIVSDPKEDKFISNQNYQKIIKEPDKLLNQLSNDKSIQKPKESYLFNETKALKELEDDEKDIESHIDQNIEDQDIDLKDDKEERLDMSVVANYNMIAKNSYKGPLGEIPDRLTINDISETTPSVIAMCENTAKKKIEENYQSRNVIKEKLLTTLEKHIPSDISQKINSADDIPDLVSIISELPVADYLNEANNYYQHLSQSIQDIKNYIPETPQSIEIINNNNYFPVNVNLNDIKIPENNNQFCSIDIDQEQANGLPNLVYCGQKFETGTPFLKCNHSLCIRCNFFKLIKKGYSKKMLKDIRNKLEQKKPIKETNEFLSLLN